MLIFNPIQDLHPSDTYVKKIEIGWKELKLSSRHRRWMEGRTDRRTDWHKLGGLSGYTKINVKWSSTLCPTRVYVVDHLIWTLSIELSGHLYVLQGLCGQFTYHIGYVQKCPIWTAMDSCNPPLSGNFSLRARTTQNSILTYLEQYL